MAPFEAEVASAAFPCLQKRYDDFSPVHEVQLLRGRRAERSEAWSPCASACVRLRDSETRARLHRSHRTSS